MTQKLAVLQALKDAGPRGVTNGEFALELHILRYSSRILELREDGHTIRTVREDGSRVRFILEQTASVPADPTPPAPVAADALFETPVRELTFDELCPRPRNAALEDWDAA